MARRLLLAVLALSLTACAGVPSSGPVRVVRRVPAEQPELPEGPAFRRRYPPNPPENGGPADIVRGFLLAQESSDGDHAIARKYLGPNVTWNPGHSLTVYTSPRIADPVVRGTTATVQATVQRVGTITPDGEFRPPLRPPRTVTFRLQRHPDVGWRLAEAPQGVLLTRDALTSAYQRVTLYFPNSARRLVPHQLFLRESDQPAAAVVRALLAGPRGSLAPAVRSALPDGTELLDPPTVVDGVVTLNFSREIRRAPQETLGMLVAQVVWTLTEPSLAVEAVRLQAERQEIRVPGREAREHRRADWEEYAPLPRPFDERLFFVRNGAPYALDAGGAVSRVAPLAGVRSLAVNRAGTHLAAVVRIPGGRDALEIVALSGGGPPRRALTADRITAPTWEPGGDIAWVATKTGGTTQVVAVPVAGAVAPVPATLPAVEVVALRLSPDGSRVAILAGRTVDEAVLWVARVERTASGARVVAVPSPVAPTVAGTTAVAFDGAGQLLVAGLIDGVRGVARLDVDGFGILPQRVQGLPAKEPVTALTSSAATPPDRVASVGGRMWRRTPGADWAPIAGAGTAATYAG